jgi:hypothetical protein
MSSFYNLSPNSMMKALSLSENPNLGECRALTSTGKECSRNAAANNKYFCTQHYSMWKGGEDVKSVNDVEEVEETDDEEKERIQQEEVNRKRAEYSLNYRNKKKERVSQLSPNSLQTYRTINNAAEREKFLNQRVPRVVTQTISFAETLRLKGLSAAYVYAGNNGLTDIQKQEVHDMPLEEAKIFIDGIINSKI